MILTTRHRGEAARLLPLLFERSLRHFGGLHWWPGETREEVIIGAVLTQNTAWTNVERALASLRAEAPLTLRAMAEMPKGHLAKHLRPVGYFTLKARRVQAVARWFIERCGLLEPKGSPGRERRDTVPNETGNPGTEVQSAGRLGGVAIPPRRRFAEEGLSVNLSPLIGLQGAELEALRQELLEVNGIGPETADSILLYALEGETFVVDAYTMRIGERHGLFPAGTTYEEVKLIFEGILGRRVDLFNEYHAQLVAIGKHYCKTRNPLCAKCPLGNKESFAYGKQWKAR